MQSGKHVILCVDDDQDILAALRVVLESKGYQVATAATAAEGIDVYVQCRPDVVIVDLMMEEVDSGLTFARELKALGNTVPVFFLSSTGDYLYGATDVGDVGASGVFQKPINPAELLRLLGKKLGEPVHP
jgi:DNA-binding response OmpR family regulator